MDFANGKGYNAYGAYLKDKYQGQRVFKVIVDGNFTCPNRDGSKGFGGNDSLFHRKFWKRRK